MPATSPIRCAVPAAVLAAVLAVPAGAAAHETRAGGAASAPERPQVEMLECGTGDRRSCPHGEFLAVRGENLDSVDKVVFLGRRGRGDNRRAPARRSSPHRVLLRVPDDAPSGRLRAVSRTAGTSGRSRRLRVVVDEAATELVSQTAGVFPVRGRYDFGTRTNRFGGGRGHQGQDIFADCGTPVVATHAGEVTWAKYDGRAGHYTVVTADDGTSQAYMHLRRRPVVERGERVAAGATLGAVGQSGSAHGCHLHFELWTAPGWYQGGEPVDPLPDLSRWAAGG